MTKPDDLIKTTVSDIQTAVKQSGAGSGEGLDQVRKDVFAIQQQASKAGGNFSSELTFLNESLHDAGYLPRISIVGFADGKIQTVHAGGDGKDVQNESVGSFINELVHGERGAGKTTFNPDGSEVKRNAEGQVTQVDAPKGGGTSYQYGSDGQPNNITHTNADGSREKLTSVNGMWILEQSGGQGNASEKNSREVTGVTVNPQDGTFGYSDGSNRVEQHANYVVQGKPSADGKSIVQPGSVSWIDADGSVSGRQFKYDDQGKLLEATGFGTAKDEHWVRNENGSFTRMDSQNSGLVANIAIGSDGAFSSTYIDSTGNSHTEEQRGSGLAIQKTDQPSSAGGNRK